MNACKKPFVFCKENSVDPALNLLFSMPIVFGFGEFAYKKSVPTMKRKMNDQPDHSEPSGLAKYFTALTKSV